MRRMLEASLTCFDIPQNSSVISRQREANWNEVYIMPATENMDVHICAYMCLCSSSCLMEYNALGVSKLAETSCLFSALLNCLATEEKKRILVQSQCRQLHISCRLLPASIITHVLLGLCFLTLIYTVA